MDNMPEVEKKEMYDFYSSKGFNDDDANRVVELLYKYKGKWS